MRVAFSGAHRTGKSSLIEAIAERVPGYAVIDEPYRTLEDDGYEFSDPPTVEDFTAQLRSSIESIAAASQDALIDRCPLDFIAYLRAIDDDFAIGDWLDDLRDSVARLDLIVVVSIETPDRIAVAAHEDRRLRRRVDELVRELVADDSLALGLDAEIVEVAGSLPQRVREVMQRLR